MHDPMTVAHEGGVFVSRTLPDGDEALAILDLNARLLRAFELERGATHAEFIRGEDGQYYFLEVAARVGYADGVTLRTLLRRRLHQRIKEI